MLWLEVRWRGPTGEVPRQDVQAPPGRRWEGGPGQARTRPPGASCRVPGYELDRLVGEAGERRDRGADQKREEQGGPAAVPEDPDQAGGVAGVERPLESLLEHVDDSERRAGAQPHAREGAGHALVDH